MRLLRARRGIVAVAGVASLVAYPFLPPPVAPGVYLAIVAGAVAVAVRAGRRGGLGVSSWWRLLVAGLAVWAAGDLLSLPATAPGWVGSAAGALSLGGYLLLAASLWRLARQAVGATDRDLVVDCVIVVLAAALPMWHFVVDPANPVAWPPTAARDLAMLHPLLDMVLVGFMIRLALSGHCRVPALSLLSAGFTSLLAVDVAVAVAQQRSTDLSAAFVDVGALVFCLLVAAAASHPSAASLGRRDGAREELTPMRVTLLSTAVLVGPVVALADHLRGGPAVGPVTVVTSLVIACLVTARLASLAVGARNALRRLDDSQERFRRLVENAVDVVFRYDTAGAGGFQFIGPSVGSLLGYTPEEFYRDPGLHLRLVHPDDRALLVAVPDDPSCPPPAMRLRWRHRDGSLVWTELHNVAVRDHDGRLVAVEGIARDVTRQQQQDEALRAHARQQAAVAQFGSDALAGADLEELGDRAAGIVACGLDVDAVTVFIRPGPGAVPVEATAGQGRGPADGGMFGGGVSVLIPAGDAHDPVGAISVCTVSPRAFPDEHLNFLQGIAHVLAQAAIRQRFEQARERRFRSLADNSPDVVARFDRGARLLYANRAAVALTGKAPADLVGHTLREAGQPAETAAVNEAHVEKAVRTGASAAYEFVVPAAEGERVFLSRYVPELGEDGEVETVLYIGHDATEQRRAQERLEETVRLLRHTDRLRRQALSHLQNAEKEERRRIAADIHDDVIQMMAAVGMRLEILDHYVDGAAATQALDTLFEVVQQSIARLRDLIVRLHPRLLDRLGLGAAITESLASAFPAGGPAVEFDDRLAEPVAPDVAAILYRIAHEAVTNVRKHAGADHVTILVDGADGGVHLRVRDDGAGFCPASSPQPDAGGHHFGLVAMRERAELAGGWLRVDSAPGSGTTVEAWVPVDCREPETRAAAALPAAAVWPAAAGHRRGRRGLAGPPPDTAEDIRRPRRSASC